MSAVRTKLTNSIKCLLCANDTGHGKAALTSHLEKHFADMLLLSADQTLSPIDADTSGIPSERVSREEPSDSISHPPQQKSDQPVLSMGEHSWSPSASIIPLKTWEASGRHVKDGIESPRVPTLSPPPPLILEIKPEAQTEAHRRLIHHRLPVQYDETRETFTYVSFRLLEGRFALLGGIFVSLKYSASYITMETVNLLGGTVQAIETAEGAAQSLNNAMLSSTGTPGVIGLIGLVELTVELSNGARAVVEAHVLPGAAMDLGTGVILGKPFIESKLGRDWRPENAMTPQVSHETAEDIARRYRSRSSKLPTRSGTSSSRRRPKEIS